MTETPRLERRLGLFAVSMSGVGVILGAGIYALIGPAAGHAGGAMWLSFVIAATIAGLTGLTYARFARLRPKNSPEFQYASMGFGPRIGFLAGWLMIWADLISVGAVALGFGGYLGSITPLPIVVGALGLITATSLLAYRGIGESVALAVVFTLVEIGGLVLIIAVGVPDWGGVDYFATPGGFGGIWTASALVLFAYLGFDELGNLAEETHRPERTLPLALAIAFVISSVIYVLVAVSAVSAVGWEVLAGSDAPLAEVAGKALGDNAGRLLTLVALAATANTVLLLVIAGSRSLQGMASSKVLPGVLASIGRRRTPWVALLVTWLVSISFAMLGDLELVARITNAAILLSFAIVNLALIRTLARLRSGTSWRNLTFDVLIPGGAAISCLGLLTQTGILAIAIGATIGVLGVAGNAVFGQRIVRPPLP